MDVTRTAAVEHGCHSPARVFVVNDCYADTQDSPLEMVSTHMDNSPSDSHSVVFSKF